MKILKKIDFKCIEINFEYEEQIITIKAEPYRTIDYIKEKVINKIIGLSPNIHLYYLGKDISEYGSEKIGNFFNKREKVTIKVKEPPTSHLLNSPKNIINNNHQNNFLNYKEKTIEGLRNKSVSNLGKNQKEIKIVKLSRNQNNKIKIDDFNKSLFPRNKSETSLPFLQNISLSNNTNNFKTNNKKLKKLSIKLKDVEMPCGCRKHNISEYCRNCKKFICVECRADQKHKNHLTIHLNMYNIEENVKNYGKLIQNDIQNKIEMNRNIFSKNEMLDDDMLANRKQRILQKYQETISTYQKVMTGVDNALKSEDKERTSLVINAYNDLSQKMNKQLLDLLDKLNNNYINCNKKIMFNDLRSFFDEINNKEETLSFLGKDVIKYHLKNEINTKLKSSLDKIDRVLDELTDENNPFNLDQKYYEELVKMDIIKEPKNIKEKNVNNIEEVNKKGNNNIINLNKNMNDNEDENNIINNNNDINK